MSSSAAPSLAHRSIANIRTETGSGISGGPASPHTPSRNISSTFGSPSSLRAEEDIIVIELGSRFIKLGFAGEPAPKAVLSLGPEQLRRPEQQQSGGEALPTVEEQDESPPTSPVEEERSDGNIEVLIQSVEPVENLTLPFQQLSEPCENTYFAPHYSRSSFDDDELPVHHLIYQHLVQLPIDARAVCMSRIVFIGGCSRVIGLKRRIFDELSKLVHERGWDPVQGRAPKQYENNALLKRGSRRATEGPTEIEPPARETEERRVTGEDEPRSAADVIEDSLKKRDSHYPRIQGALRPLGSLGPWGGASLACQLKVMAMANIDRELWLQQGVNGASRPSEVDVKAQQRQSMGPGGLMRGAGGQSNWTLGAWGTL
ncbi:uncharacterized protein N0V96_006812 [Colletotrichum fioriniae]|uniref:uncharacterized protein n=1 Tax=Colletotrichum fioriniae TaxID=710243 RepID=UPI0032D9FFE8|nr:hypothetical protein N0V96_006812 [Colletotrichum fioriniae]